jgi:23S rRNA (cytosine1962-C5)-methyltransferase
LNTVRVNRKAADRVASGHPWIFSSDILDHSEASPGEAVSVMGPAGKSKDAPGKFLRAAHFSSTSQIALRLLTRKREAIDRAFFLRRLREALAHRDRVVENSDSYRLVFSEADQLPGLIVDRYGSYLVMQTLDQGMEAARDLIADCLNELLQPSGILARNDASIRRLEGLPQEVVTLSGEIPDKIAIHMNGLQLAADLLHGQKTGAYLDQRENYIAAARYAHGRVLDCFSSTGGFALHIAHRRQTNTNSRVESIEGVESSDLAISTAQANAEANHLTDIAFRKADVFDYLSGLPVSKDAQRYSTIILDPPAFAKSRKQLDDAERGYRDINFRALRLLEPGGILVTCSCSHHMSEGMLLGIVAQAALDAGKTIRVLERRVQAADHPILLTVPETLYLKCLILEVLPA